MIPHAMVLLQQLQDEGVAPPAPRSYLALSLGGLLFRNGHHDELKTLDNIVGEEIDINATPVYRRLQPEERDKLGDRHRLADTI
mmetsp:Transcript_22718/g.53730  ORF Transcript_22718/g.53730 Transcript_22718/m.53730 type:complete len:84 (+) Transcript_22718:2-253(+)